MKKLALLTLALFACIFTYAQTTPPKWYAVTPNDGVIMGLQAVAGSADGLNQVLVHHIHTFERYYPSADMTWWDPRISQDRKQHMWTPVSDGFHVTRSVEHVANYTSIALSAGEFMQYEKKDRWKRVAFKLLYSFVVNRVAFNLVYKTGFNDTIERQKAGRG